MLKWCACSAAQKGNYYTNEPIRQFGLGEEKRVTGDADDGNSCIADTTVPDDITALESAPDTDSRQTEETSSSENRDGIRSCSSAVGKCREIAAGRVSYGNPESPVMEAIVSGVGGRRATSIFRLKKRREREKKLRLQKDGQQGLIYRINIDKTTHHYPSDGKIIARSDAARSQDITDEDARSQMSTDWTYQNKINYTAWVHPKEIPTLWEGQPIAMRNQISNNDNVEDDSRPRGLVDFNDACQPIEETSNVDFQLVSLPEEEYHRFKEQGRLHLDDVRAIDGDSCPGVQLQHDLRGSHDPEVVDPVFNKTQLSPTQGANNLGSVRASKQRRKKTDARFKSFGDLEVVDVPSKGQTNSVSDDRDVSTHADYGLKKGNSLPLIDTCIFTNEVTPCAQRGEAEKNEGAPLVPVRAPEKDRLMKLMIRPFPTTERYGTNHLRENCLTLKRKPKLALSNRLYKMVSKFDELTASTNDGSPCSENSLPVSVADVEDEKGRHWCRPHTVDVSRDTKLIKDDSLSMLNDKICTDDYCQNVPVSAAGGKFVAPCLADANESMGNDLEQSALVSSKDGIALTEDNDTSECFIAKSEVAVKSIQNDVGEPKACETKPKKRHQNSDIRAINEIVSDDKEDYDDRKTVYSGKEVDNLPPAKEDSAYLQVKSRISSSLQFGKDVRSSQGVISSSSGAVVSPKFRENLNKLKEFYETIITDFEEYVKDNSSSPDHTPVEKVLQPETSIAVEKSTLTLTDKSSDGASSSWGNASEKLHSTRIALSGRDMSDALSSPSISYSFYPRYSSSTRDNMNAFVLSTSAGNGPYSSHLTELHTASSDPAAIYSLFSVERQRNDPISDKGICQRRPGAAPRCVASVSNETASRTVLRRTSSFNIAPKVFHNFFDVSRGTLGVTRDVTVTLSSVPPKSNQNFLCSHGAGINFHRNASSHGPSFETLHRDAEGTNEEINDQYVTEELNEFSTLRLDQETSVSSENLKTVLNFDESFVKGGLRENGDELSNDLFTRGQFALSAGGREALAISPSVGQTVCQERSLGGQLGKRCLGELEEVHREVNNEEVKAGKGRADESGHNRKETVPYQGSVENSTSAMIDIEDGMERNTTVDFSATFKSTFPATGEKFEFSDMEADDSTFMFVEQQKHAERDLYRLNDKIKFGGNELQESIENRDLRQSNDRKQVITSHTRAESDHNDLLSAYETSRDNISFEHPYDNDAGAGSYGLMPKPVPNGPAFLASNSALTHFPSIHLTPSSCRVFTTLVASTASPLNLNTLDPYDCCTFSSSLSRPIPSVLPAPLGEDLTHPQPVSTIRTSVSSSQKPISVVQTSRDLLEPTSVAQQSISDQGELSCFQQNFVFNSRGNSKLTATDHRQPEDASCPVLSNERAQGTPVNTFTPPHCPLSDASELSLHTLRDEEHCPRNPFVSFSNPARDSGGSYFAHSPVYSHMRLPNDIPKSFLHSCKAPKPPPPEPPPKPTRMRKKEATREVERSCLPRQSPDKKNGVPDNIDLPLPTVVDRIATDPAVECVAGCSDDRADVEEKFFGETHGTISFRRGEKEKTYNEIGTSKDAKSFDRSAQRDFGNNVSNVIVSVKKKKSFANVCSQVRDQALLNESNEEIMHFDPFVLEEMKSLKSSFQQNETKNLVLKPTMSFQNVGDDTLHSLFPSGEISNGSSVCKGKFKYTESDEIIATPSADDRDYFSRKSGKGFTESHPKCFQKSTRQRDTSFKSARCETESDPSTRPENYPLQAANISKRRPKRNKFSDQFFRYSVWKRTRFKRNEANHDRLKKRQAIHDGVRESSSASLFPSYSFRRIPLKSSQSMMQLSKRRALFDQHSKNSHKKSFLESPGKNSDEFRCNSANEMLQRAVHLLEVIERDHDDRFSRTDYGDLAGLKKAASSPSLLPHELETASVLNNESHGENKAAESRGLDMIFDHKCTASPMQKSRSHSDCQFFYLRCPHTNSVDDRKSGSKRKSDSGLLNTVSNAELKYESREVGEASLGKGTNDSDHSDWFCLRAIETKTSDYFDSAQRSEESQANRSRSLPSKIIPAEQLRKLTTAASGRKQNESQKFPCISRTSCGWSSPESLSNNFAEASSAVIVSSSVTRGLFDGSAVYAESSGVAAHTPRLTSNPVNIRRKKSSDDKIFSEYSLLKMPLQNLHLSHDLMSSATKDPSQSKRPKPIKLRNVRQKATKRKQYPNKSKDNDTAINYVKKHPKQRKTDEVRKMPGKIRRDKNRRHPCDGNAVKKFVPSFARKYSCFCCCCKCCVPMLEKIGPKDSLAAFDYHKEMKSTKNRSADHKMAIVHLDYHRARRPRQVSVSWTSDFDDFPC